MNHPLPDSTDRGPAYQGRLLPRPADDVVDQGLAFDVGTLTRRRMFRVLGLGAGAAVLAACSSGTDSTASATSTPASGLTEIPDETAGPYPGDGSNGPDVLEETGIVRQDIRASFGESTTVAEGVPLEFELTVLDMAGGGGPLVGAAVYAWHCDRAGNYSLYSSGLENENYLRGVQITDDSGKISFTSIFPACYSGRWPHIHFEVYPDEAAIADSANAISTSQLALPQNICDTVYATEGYEQSVTNQAQITLQSDNVFGDDGGIHQIAAVSGDLTAGYKATLTVPIDTTTTPTAGAAPAGGGGGGGQGGGPGGTPPTGQRGTPPSGGPGGGAPPTGAPPALPGGSSESDTTTT